MNQQTRFNLFYVALAFMGVLLLQGLWARSQQVANIPYSQFQGLVRAGDVEKVTIGPDRIEGSLKKPLEGKSRFVTTRVDPDISKDLDAAGVTYAGRLESNFLPMLLSWILPVLFFFGVWMFLARRMQGGAGGPGGGLMAIGKSKAKVYVETDTKTSFADVAGVDEAKAELAEVVAFLKDPKSYGRLGARMPKGVLLVGPPGTGKTLLAQAVAGEASVPFFSISGSEFVEMFVGVGAARVRDLFEQARKKAPAIIFIDELDALGRARNAMGGMARPRREGADAQPAAGGAGRLRRLHRASCCSPPPTGPRCSIRPCCAPAASTGRCWSTGPTGAAASRSWRCTPGR